MPRAQSCIQKYWQMLMIFCPILIVHINSCLRLNFFSSFSIAPLHLPTSLTYPSPQSLLTSPPSPLPLHASISLIPSPSLTLPHLSLSLPSLTSPSSALPHLPSLLLPHLSLSISPSPSLSIPLSSSLTSPLLQLSSPFFYFNRLCQPCVCGGGKTCM